MELPVTVGGGGRKRKGTSLHRAYRVKIIHAKFEMPV